MANNPYAPPRAAVADAVAEVPSELPIETRVYSVNQIATATFLASAIAGGWLIATNFKAMGLQDQARQAIGWGILGTILIIGAAILLPDKVPNFVVPLATAIGLRAWADTRFGKLLAQHRAAGGSQFSWWRVVGLILLFVAIVFAVAFAVVMLLYLFGLIDL